MQEVGMKQGDVKLAKWLTYAGTLPMLAGVLLAYLPIAAIDGNQIARTYSAIIIAFLCGLHWANYFFFSDKCPGNLLIASNVAALLAWASLLMAHTEIAIIMQILCFAYLLLLDKRLQDAGVLPEWFYDLRRNATVIVVFSLVALLV
jgi:hypothetical protein